MTEFLKVCLWASVCLFAGTIGLLTVPITHRELKLWRSLRISSLRRWVSQREPANEPLDSQRTVRIARRNLVWHLILTGLFCFQIGWAVASPGRWWRPLTTPLVVFCIGYFAGSLVQRQKVAIVRLREDRVSGSSAT